MIVNRIGILVALPTMVCAGTLDLSGKVFDEAGRGLFKVVVTLPRAGVSTITKPDGTWVIAGENATADLGQTDFDTLVYAWNGAVRARVPLPTYIQSEISQLVMTGAVAARDTTPRLDTSKIPAKYRAVAARWESSSWRPELSAGASWTFIPFDVSGFSVFARPAFSFSSKDGKEAFGFFLGYEFMHSSSESTTPATPYSYKVDISVVTNRHLLALGLSNRTPILSERFLFASDIALEIGLGGASETKMDPDLYGISSKADLGGTTRLTAGSSVGQLVTDDVGYLIGFRMQVLPFATSTQLEARGFVRF